MKRIIGLCVFAAVLIVSQPVVGAAPASEVSRDDAIELVNALRDSERPEADRDRDNARRPGAVLGFFGVRPETTVLDMFAGGGYYTEILSRYVGPEGRVFSQNNKAYRDYAAAAIEARYRDGALGNVERLDVEVGELQLADNSLDTVLLILSYHDLYFRPGDGSWPEIDGPKMLADFLAALKPGSVLGVVDHVGEAGIDDAKMSELHRIDPARIRSEIEAAGFLFDGKLDVLRNPGDDLTKPMYDPEVRGKTDRVVYRFRKPG